MDNYTFFMPQVRTRLGPIHTLMRFRRWRQAPAGWTRPARDDVEHPVVDDALAPIRILGDALADRGPLHDVTAAFAPAVITHADQ